MRCASNELLAAQLLPHAAQFCPDSSITNFRSRSKLPVADTGKKETVVVPAIQARNYKSHAQGTRGPTENDAARFLRYETPE